MLCLVDSVDQVEDSLADLFSLLGFKFNSYDGVKMEPTIEDMKETFEEESKSKNPPPYPSHNVNVDEGEGGE